MKRIALFVFAVVVVLCLLLFPRAAFSQEAQEAREPLKQEPLQQEERLAFAVSAHVSATPLPQALASWSAAATEARGSGPTLKAAANLPGERITVFAHERPLREVLQGVASLLNYEWKAQQQGPQGGRPTQYVLTRGSKARADEQALWNATVNRALGPLSRLAALTQQPASHWATIRAEMTQSGGAKPSDPLLTRGNLRHLSNASARSLLQLVRTLTPRQRRELVENERLLLAWSALTPRQRQLAQVNVLQEDPRLRLEDGTLTDVAGRRQAQENLALRQQLGLLLTVDLDPMTFGILSLDVSSAAGRSACASFLATKRELYDKDLLPVRGSPYRTAPARDALVATDEESLDQENRPFPNGFTVKASDTWSKTLERLSERLPMPLFSDNYDGAAGSLPSDPDPAAAAAPIKQTLADGLDTLCQAYGRLWWYENGALFFRSRTWFLQRRYEVPPATLAQLSHQIRPSKRLTSGALQTLSDLTVHQLMGLVSSALTAAHQNGPPSPQTTSRLTPPEAGKYAFPFLQFFRTLGEDQKQAVLSAEGLPSAQMTLAQQQEYARLCVFLLGRRALDAALVFRIESGPSFAVAPGASVHAVPAQIYYIEGAVIRLTVPYSAPERKEQSQ